MVRIAICENRTLDGVADPTGERVRPGAVGSARLRPARRLSLSIGARLLPFGAGAAVGGIAGAAGSCAVVTATRRAFAV